MCMYVYIWQYSRARTIRASLDADRVFFRRRVGWTIVKIVRARLSLTCERFQPRTFYFDRVGQDTSARQDNGAEKQVTRWATAETYSARGVLGRMGRSGLGSERRPGHPNSFSSLFPFLTCLARPDICIHFKAPMYLFFKPVI